MPERVPPWEQARLIFAQQERARRRRLEAKQRPIREQVLDLEDNRKRLAEIKKRLETEKEPGNNSR